MHEYRKMKLWVNRSAAAHPIKRNFTSYQQSAGQDPRNSATTKKTSRANHYWYRINFLLCKTKFCGLEIDPTCISSRITKCSTTCLAFYYCERKDFLWNRFSLYPIFHKTLIHYEQIRDTDVCMHAPLYFSVRKKMKKTFVRLYQPL